MQRVCYRWRVTCKALCTPRGWSYLEHKVTQYDLNILVIIAEWGVELVKFYHYVYMYVMEINQCNLIPFILASMFI